MELSLDLPKSLMELSLLLATAVFIGLFARRLGIPLTVVLAVVGFVVTWAGIPLAILELLEGDGFEQILVNLFLPILVFEAAFALSTREFMRNLAAIVALATVGVVISAVLVGGALSAGLDIALPAALLFGVIISATDPVAVVAVFRDVGVSPRLLTIVEGESMLNDGVAIVLSEILAVVALGGLLSAPQAAVDFVGVFAGGALIGGLIGMTAALVLPLLQRLPAAALSVAVAYGAALLAEAVFGFSGVVATMAAGVVLGGLTPSRASAEVRVILHELWDALSYIANALLFLFVGLLIDPGLFADNLGAIGLAIAAVLASRPLAVVPVVWLLERFTRIPRVGHRNSAVLTWGGLRGGVALALVLALPNELPQREMFVAMAGGVVFATLVLNATTISTLVHLLGLDRPTRASRYLETVARLAAIRAARSRLDRLGLDDAIVLARLDVAEAEARDGLDHLPLSQEEELGLLTLRGLHIEQRTYQGLSDAGLLPPIAARTLVQEIEDEIEEVASGGLRVDAARRSALPWYGRLHRKVLGLLPEPLGEDLLAVGYIEVSARKLAAQQACEELDLFKELPNVSTTAIDGAKQTFTHWKESATESLSKLDRGAGIDLHLLHRRQAEALARIASAEALTDLVRTGLLDESIAEVAAERISDELGHSREDKR